MFLTTTHTVEGYVIEQYLDVIAAQAVLGVTAFEDVAVGTCNVFGGRSTTDDNELAAGVGAALDGVRRQAAALGAGAVVGIEVDYEAFGQTTLATIAGRRDLADHVLMVSVSGTAVKLAPREFFSGAPAKP